jgi:molybdate transport system regulatory protein
MIRRCRKHRYILQIYSGFLNKAEILFEGLYGSCEDTGQSKGMTQVRVEPRMPIIPSRQKTKPAETRLAIRLDLASGVRIGPGKVQLLEEVARTGSISAAARAMRMAYPQAWWLLDDMSKAVGPVVETYKGGGRYGGASLTKAGRALVVEYRAIEAAAAAAADDHLAALTGDLRVR